MTSYYGAGRLWSAILLLLLLCASLQGCQPKSGEEGLYGAQTYDFGSQAGEAQDTAPDSGPVAAPSRTVASASGAITIPARSMAEWTARGNCLDPDRPAPRYGDKFKLVPIGNIIDPQLLPLYEGFINLTVHDDEARRYQQQIVWAMRTVDKRNSYASSLGGRQKALLDKSLPGGAALFDEVRLSRAGQEGAADFLIGLLPRISFFGFSIDLSDLLDPDRAPAVADNQLEQLINMPAGDLVESGDVASRLTPGIETRITGTAPLTMRVAIVNNSDADFVFVPTQYAAEAQRRVQRVTLAPPERVSISAL